MFHERLNYLRCVENFPVMWPLPSQLGMGHLIRWEDTVRKVNGEKDAKNTMKLTRYFKNKTVTLT